MKTRFQTSFLRIGLFLFILAFSCIPAFAQVTNIDISSTSQSATPVANYDNWLVRAMSPEMAGALCFENTTGAQAPVNTVPQLPQALNQPAYPLAGSPFNNGGISCFPFNTIYTFPVAANNTTDVTTTVRRIFRICNNRSTTNVTLNLTVFCDDGVNNVIIDADGPTPIFLAGVPSAAIAPITLGPVSLTLANGTHTIDIVCYDWKQPTTAGGYYTMPAPYGDSRQWNPFMIDILGSVTCSSSVLYNDPPSVISMTPITGFTSLCPGQSLTLHNATAGGTWSSTVPLVASINASTGVLTANAVGSTVIHYSLGCNGDTTLNVEITPCHCEDSCNWSLTGNTNVKATNFIGSLNAADFKIRTNNLQRMVVTSAGKVGINNTSPVRQFDVTGDARISSLPASAPNESIVFANSSGDLHSLLPSGLTNQYLSGNGTWQNVPTGGGGGTVTNADQGVTLNGNTVLLGDVCGKGGGLFQTNREINMGNNYLYFNTTRTGKIFMGSNSKEGCKKLYARLEINSDFLGPVNDYVSPDPAPSGLRFTNMNMYSKRVDNQSGGVLSLDQDGDVIFVDACCSGITETGKKIDDILTRLDKLEKELTTTRAENAELKTKLSQMNVVLSDGQNIVLHQNVPNPFAESTTISYFIPEKFSRAQIIFSTVNGEIIKTVDIKSAGKGSVNVFAADLSNGTYMYTLIIDGKKADTKKMLKQ